MGQKLIKSADIDEEFNNSNIIDGSTSPNHTINLNINTNNINLIRTKLNHHDSALSNDSGCYSNTDSVDRYSSPSNSSVLCLFDHPQTQLQTQQSTVIENQLKDESDVEDKIKNIKNNIKPFSSPFFKQKIFKSNEINKKKTQQQDSLLTKITINDELARSVSSLNLFNNNSQTSSRLNIDSLKLKIDVLYKQINHILHLKSKLSNNVNDGSPKKTGKTSNNKNKRVNFNHHKTLNQKNSTIINKLSSSLKKSNKNYLVRSHTFNSTNTPPVYLPVDNNNSKSNKSNRLGKYLIKNGRKFLIWKKNTINEGEGEQQQQQQQYQSQNDSVIQHDSNVPSTSPKLRILKNKNRFNFCVNNHNSLISCVNDSVNNDVLNLIAAKLLLENIDLTRYPYTDDVRINILIKCYQVYQVKIKVENS
jgi:hypothetical protein